METMDTTISKAEHNYEKNIWDVDSREPQFNILTFLELRFLYNISSAIN